MPGFVTDFRKLAVYQDAMDVSRRAFDLSNSFPSREAFALVDQLRRASSSIGAQIAEGWGKRQYPRHFRAKLSEADAEQLETRHWLAVAVDRGYLRPEQVEGLTNRLDRIGRQLNVMIRKAEHFRTHRSR